MIVLIVILILTLFNLLVMWLRKDDLLILILLFLNILVLSLIYGVNYA